jgi:chromosome segregation ATPase
MNKPNGKPVDNHEGTSEQRIADLERELRLKDERINELKDEIDESRSLMRRMEEHVQERDEYLETFITTFGLVLNDKNEWENGEFIQQHNGLVDKFNDLIDRYNKLVGNYNRYAMAPQPIGRPIAASEAQQAEAAKHHRRGRSARWIAEEMSLSRRTVTTIIGKFDGTDRGTAQRRRRLGLEPNRKDWRPASIKRLPKRAAEHFKKGRELLKEAKGLGAQR